MGKMFHAKLRLSLKSHIMSVKLFLYDNAILEEVKFTSYIGTVWLLSPFTYCRHAYRHAM